MRNPSWRSLFLSCFLGLTAGSGLLPLSSIRIAVQAAELSSQGSQDGVIKSCTGQSINLGAPQLTEADLKMLTVCSSGVVPQLLEALKSRDWKVKVIAAHTLGLYGKQAQSVIPELSGLMQDENADVRFAVVQALGDIGTEAVVPVLAKALQDKDENVRVSAADAFLKIGAVAKPAKPVLIAALWDGNWYVRSRAAATIAKLGLEESDIPNLLKPWRDGFKPENIALISLMIKIDPHVHEQIQDIPLFFIKALQNKDLNVRENAALALEQINRTRVSKVYLLDISDALLTATQDKEPKVRQKAFQAMGTVISGFFYHKSLENLKIPFKDRKEPEFLKEIPNVLPALHQGLKDPEPIVRQAAINSLGQLFAWHKVSIGSNFSDIISTLFLLLEDPDPSVRQSVVSLLWQIGNSLDRYISISSSERSQLSQAIFLTLVKSLYNQDGEVRRLTGQTLNEVVLMPTLIRILKNRSLDLGVRRNAIAAIWMRRGFMTSIDNKSRNDIVDLLEKLLQDEDLSIRLNAAMALQSVKKIDSKQSISIFIEGLRSDNPLIRFDAITALNRMCGFRSLNTQECADTKIALPLFLPLLLDILKIDIKPIQYAAALAIADIEPTEESGVSILSKILLEEEDGLLRSHAKNALKTIGSQYALSTMTQSLKIDDSLVRYSRSCRNGGYMPTGVYVNASINLSPPSPSQRLSLLLKALENDNVRFSAAETFSSGNSSQNIHILAIDELISILAKHSIQHHNYPVLSNIFKLKKQDFRRSAVYALGRIGSTIKLDKFRKGSEKEYFQKTAQNLQAKRKITKALIAIINDRTEDISLRWVASASLQEMDVSVDQFFVENDLVNPKTARWNFPHGFFIPWVQHKSRVGGIIFDIYSGDLIYDDRTGCGDGLSDIYNTLRNLLNLNKK